MPSMPRINRKKPHSSSTERLYHPRTTKLGMTVLTCRYGSKKSQMSGEGKDYMGLLRVVSVQGMFARGVWLGPT